MKEIIDDVLKKLDDNETIIEFDLINKLQSLTPTKINDCNDDGYTLLHLACELGYVEIAKYLIENNADINQKNHNGLTPLMVLCAEENPNQKILTLLLEKTNLELNDTSNTGNTALHIAILKNNANETAIALITKNANGYLNNSAGENPLDLAIKNKKYSIAAAILNNCNVDESNKKMLHAICIKSNIDLFNTIKVLDLNFAIVDTLDCTPLHYLCKNYNKELLDGVIEKAGEDLKNLLCISDNLGRTPLHYAAANPDFPADIFKTLLDTQGIEIDAQDNLGNTPLHYACEAKNVALVEMLLDGKTTDQARTMLETKNQAGESPLDIMSENSAVFSQIFEKIKIIQPVSTTQIDNFINDDPRANPSPPPTTVTVRQNPTTTTDDIIEIQGDGNCFFRAVSQSLCGTQDYHTQLRAIAIDYMRKNMQDSMIASNIVTDKVTFEAYTEKHSQDKEWADDPIISALANALSLKFKIKRTDNQKNITVSAENSTQDVLLSYQQDHYNTRKPISTNSQDNITLIKEKAKSTSAPTPAAEPPLAPTSFDKPPPTAAAKVSSPKIVELLAWHQYTTDINPNNFELTNQEKSDFQDKLTILNKNNNEDTEKFFTSITQQITTRGYEEVVKQQVTSPDPQYLGLINIQPDDKVEYAQYHIDDNVTLNLATVNNHVYISKKSILDIKQRQLSLSIEVENSGIKEFIEFHEGELLLLDRAKIGGSKIGGKGAIVELLNSKDYISKAKVAATPEIITEVPSAPPPQEEATNAAAQPPTPSSSAATLDEGKKPQPKTGVEILDKLSAKSTAQTFEEYTEITHLTTLQNELRAAFKEKSKELEAEETQIKDQFNRRTNDLKTENLEKIASPKKSTINSLTKGISNSFEKISDFTLEKTKRFKIFSSKRLTKEGARLLLNIQEQQKELKTQNDYAQAKLTQVIELRNIEKTLTSKIKDNMNNFADQVFSHNTHQCYANLPLEDKITLLSLKNDNKKADIQKMLDVLAIKNANPGKDLQEVINNAPELITGVNKQKTMFQNLLAQLGEKFLRSTTAASASPAAEASKPSNPSNQESHSK